MFFSGVYFVIHRVQQVIMHIAYSYLSLFDDVIQSGKAATHCLLLLLFEANLNVSHHGKQGYNLLVMFQALLTGQRGLGETRNS